jgi:hypothetical protein
VVVARGVGSFELTGHDRAQQRAQLGGAPGSKYRFKARLRHGPSFACRPQTFVAGLGQPQRLGAAVGGVRLDLDQSVAL